MRGLWCAIAFLTTIPVPSRLMGPDIVSPRAMLWWWAPIGALIGAATGALVCLAATRLPWLTCAGLGVVTLAVLSGGLHLEGFMDTCDGLGSRAPRERALAIMKDSRAGAFGVIGVVCLLLPKFAVVAGLEPNQGALLLALAPIVSRAAQVGVLCLTRYARPEGGMGGAFFAAAGLPHLALAVVVAGAAVTAAVGTSGLYALGGAWALTALPGVTIARRLGGHTGDTVGAMSELSEMAFLLAAALVPFPG